MPINKNSLQAKINNLSNKSGVHQNILLKAFFFDEFLKRLSISKYSENFVFKGGFLLSTSLGINLRSTMDVDFLLTKMKLDKDVLVNTLTEVASIDIDDSVTFEINEVNEIRLEDEYGGYNIVLIGRLENIKEVVSIDIATGDPITPEAINYEYRTMLNNDVLHFKAYNFETIVSEKMQTVLFKDVINSRSKDYYDLFIIYKLKLNSLDNSVLKEAFARTCNYRKTIFTKAEAKEIVNRIENDSQMRTRWNSYCKKNKFAEGIKFEETIHAISYFLEIVL